MQKRNLLQFYDDYFMSIKMFLWADMQNFMFAGRNCILTGYLFLKP